MRFSGVLALCQAGDFLPEVEAALSSHALPLRLGNAESPGPVAADELVIYTNDGDATRRDALMQQLPPATVISVSAPNGLEPFLAIDQVAGHFAADAAGLTGLALFAGCAHPATLLENAVDGEVEERRVQNHGERSGVLEELERWAEKQGARRPLRAALVECAEEMIMNALYDAPVDEAGVPVFAEIDGKARLLLNSPRAVSVRFSADEKQIGLAVADEFGRLERGTISKYFRRGIASQIEDKTLGAGLGLYLVANRATNIFLHRVPGRRTELTCLFSRELTRPLHGFAAFEPVGAVP